MRDLPEREAPEEKQEQKDPRVKVEFRAKWVLKASKVLVDQKDKLASRELVVQMDQWAQWVFKVPLAQGVLKVPKEILESLVHQDQWDYKE